MDTFSGQSCEINTRSPGGFKYAHMAQVVYQQAVWAYLSQVKSLNLALDFNHPALKPHQNFADMLINASVAHNPGRDPRIAMLTESIPFDYRDENTAFISYLEKERGVEAHLVPLFNSGMYLYGPAGIPTVIYFDINIDEAIAQQVEDIPRIMHDLKKVGALIVNPRGLEILGDNALLEAVGRDDLPMLSGSIRQLVPKTVVLTKTNKEEIWQNKDEYVVKPRQGHSGAGFKACRGFFKPDFWALPDSMYVAQTEIPQAVSSFSNLVVDSCDRKKIEKAFSVFRMFFGPAGLIGFASRYSRQVPVNIGAGGGCQAIVVNRTGMSNSEVTEIIHHELLNLSVKELKLILECAERMSKRLGLVYKGTGTRVSLKPLVINEAQIIEMNAICKNLWKDLVYLEEAMLTGTIFPDSIFSCDEHKEIVLANPWLGSPALIAVDGLFNFREE